jgi:hypothetical protein
VNRKLPMAVASFRRRPRIPQIGMNSINLDAQQVHVGDLLQGYDAPTLQTLIGYQYLVEAINALCA